MHQKKILFIKLLNSSFIKIDEDILSEKYQVISFLFKKVKGIAILKDLFFELMFMIKNIWKADIIYVWFADFHAVIPTLIGRLFRVKVIIVIGGVDAAYRKELNYGVKTRTLGRISLYLSTACATNLLPVSWFTYNNLLENVNHRLSKKCKLIYNCYNELFTCSENNHRKNNIVTVCSSNSKVTLLVKGVDFYIDLARTMPELTFYVVGLSGEALKYLQTISSANVVLIQRIPQQELKKLFCSSRVICQFSRQEAFGVALLEGISSGCYPVGYNFGGTKEILKDNLGILINQLDIEEGKKAIEEALNKTKEDIEPIKESIENRFSCEIRKKELMSFIDNL